MSIKVFHDAQCEISLGWPVFVADAIRDAGSNDMMLRPLEWKTKKEDKRFYAADEICEWCKA
eukprot:7338254-Ditylum_brightwellii.AAC.1